MFPALGNMHFKNAWMGVGRDDPTQARGANSTPSGTFLCPWPLACFVAWATPAAVSQWGHQASGTNVL